MSCSILLKTRAYLGVFSCEALPKILLDKHHAIGTHSLMVLEQCLLLRATAGTSTGNNENALHQDQTT